MSVCVCVCERDKERERVSRRRVLRSVGLSRSPAAGLVS